MVGFGVAAQVAAIALTCCSLTVVASKPGKKEPMQIRLAYAGDKGMTVSWNTFHKLDEPKVHYGTKRHDLSKIATSSVSVTYNTSTTYNNHVKIKGLEPDTMYYYRPSYANHVHQFKTSRAAGDHKPFTVAAVVDMGTMGELGLSHKAPADTNPLKPGEMNTIQSLNMHQDEFEFLFHPGDIAYADYWLKEEIQGYLPKTKISQGYKIYEKILNKFYDEMQKITSKKPYLVGPGNHEANCDNGGTTDPSNNKTYTVDICLPGQTNFTGFINHFRMPSEESGGTGNFWYSFDYGMTHFVMFDTETDFGHGLIAPDEPGGSADEDSGPFGATENAQIKFLKADLAAVDRKKTPWVVAAGHRPWYISAQDSSDICTECQHVFEPILKKYGVDLVLSGHYHVYQRNTPLYKGMSDPNGLNNPTFPWYITNGAAGHYDGLDTLNTTLDSYAVFAEDTTYGWSRLKFHNCTHLTQEFVRSGDGKVLDSATLYKNRKC